VRGLALVGALVVLVASPARADGEGAVDLDLDAFADHLTDALAGEDDEVPVEAWEERLEPQAEDDWLAARGAREPEVDHPGGAQRAATVGLTVRFGEDLAITRLVFADSARTVAFVKQVLRGHLRLPLGSGPSGRGAPTGAILLEPRNRDLLIVRLTSVDEIERALVARAAAWVGPGLPRPSSAVEGLALVDRDLLALAWVDAERARSWLDPREAASLIGAGRFGGREAGSRDQARTKPLASLLGRLDRALGPLSPPEER
jgi:hypothetical protein